MVTIYVLRCVPTGEVYVGCTAGKLGKRMREHRCLLRGGKHGTRLQAAWNLHGASAFRMEPLEGLATGSVVEKREAELRWLRHFQEQGLLLNDHVISFQAPPGAPAKAAAARVASGYSPSPESNEKRRLAQLGIPKGHGAKISATKQAKKLAMR